MRRDWGQMFIELVVGIGVVLVALVAAVSLSIQSTKTSRVAGNRSEAMVIAEEKLEMARKDRDNDVNDFFVVNPRASGTCAGVVPAEYSCNIVYDYQPGQVTVTVTVGWKEGANDFEADMSTVLTNKT